MREATKKRLLLQEVLFGKMTLRSEFVLHKHLQHAVQVIYFLMLGQLPTSVYAFAINFGAALGCLGGPVAHLCLGVT